ncbi:hypothetical protein ACWGE1_13770 [Streptomyces sp. NPDC054932]
MAQKKDGWHQDRGGSRSAAMPAEKARLGLERGVAEADSKPGRAYRRINNTSARIDGDTLTSPRSQPIALDRR